MIVSSYWIWQLDTMAGDSGSISFSLRTLVYFILLYSLNDRQHKPGVQMRNDMIIFLFLSKIWSAIGNLSWLWVIPAFTWATIDSYGSSFNPKRAVNKAITGTWKVQTSSKKC